MFVFYYERSLLHIKCTHTHKQILCQIIKPVYKTFPGWKTSTNGIKNMEALPENAKKYIYAVEDFIGAKVSSISTSPEREDTILVENPFDI